MKVGVLFPSRLVDPGEIFADARAMEAAGVDSVWMEDDGVGLDPLQTLAAIAAAAHDLRLGFIVPPGATKNAELERRIASLRHLSRGRAVVGMAEAASINAAGERWRRVGVPLDSNAWAETLAQAEGQVDGVIVPLNPRLLDMLLHPDQAIDRPDLQLAQG